MEQEKEKAGSGGWVFLLFVLVCYGAIGLINADIVERSLSFFVTLTRNILPVLVMVFFLLLAVDLLIEPKWVRRNLGSDAGVKGWLIAAVCGVLASGPVYVWYALLRDLRGKGMRAALAAVFLYGRAVKLPLLPLMIHYFGVAYTLVLSVYLLAFSIVSGILMRKLDKPEPG